MQTTLAGFREQESTESFSLQNSKLLKISLNQVTIQAKLGSMVAYQGDVKFEHAGSGGLGRMLKKAVTGEGTQLMKISGTGAMMGGGLYNLSLQGTGWVAILSDGPPVLLNVAAAPTFADAQAAITWSSGVSTGIRTDFKMKNLIGRGSGETVQMSFSGQGWVLVQPSEGQVAGAAQQSASSSSNSGLGGLLNS